MAICYSSNRKLIQWGRAFGLEEQHTQRHRGLKGRATFRKPKGDLAIGDMQELAGGDTEK